MILKKAAAYFSNEQVPSEKILPTAARAFMPSEKTGAADAVRYNRSRQAVSEQHLPKKKYDRRKELTMNADNHNLPQPGSAGLPEPDRGLNLLAEPQRLPAGAGWTWIRQAWLIFKMRPGKWMTMTVLLFALVFALSLLSGVIAAAAGASSNPVGDFIIGILTTALAAGMLYAAHRLLADDHMSVSMLFEGVRRKLSAFVLLSLFNWLYMVLAVVLLGVLAGASGMETMSAMGGSQEAMISYLQQGGWLSILLLMLLFLVIYIPMIMMLWSAPALILLHDTGVWKAMKMSLKGCMANIKPLLVYGLVVSCVSVFLMIVMLLSAGLLGFALNAQNAVIVLMVVLGLVLALVLIPVMQLTYYTSYRGIWTDVPLE